MAPVEVNRSSADPTVTGFLLFDASSGGYWQPVG